MNAMDQINKNLLTKQLYSQLLDSLNQIGSYEVEIKKTSLHIVNGRAFLGVHPRKDTLLINIVTNQPLQYSWVKKTQQVSANRYHNEVLMSETEHLNNKIVNSIKQAYELTK